ncbi:protein-methionine sulfoxide oxidase mical3a isoform X3 [Gadus macrocephalus]|uniref:protein-methionine sulfoxide oxidase mical3a isoform X3 n=1 Tax=Gadus macrocephalus TaxID=80720 RepID=UPI0028CB186C|nr:protein-methionine sulfoxide oxidase mical3a isoform X3 [Gadus macrocephalus]
MGDVGAAAAGGGVKVIRSHTLFDNFVQASTFKGTLKAFQELCDHLELQPTDSRVFYHKLKSKLNYWKAKALWAKLDKRAAQKEYKKGRACANSKCLIIGAGPCGLRTAIELGFLGAKVVLLEKRDAFSRNNVLHLWPFTIQDLRGLGAKKFYGKFCAGAIDHISIRQLQLMLLKVALLVGIEIHVNVEFKGLIEPPEDQESEKIGWRAEINPRTHPVNELEFDVIIGADGRRNTLAGFARKEFRGKLAIAITANFINRHTTAEASVEEISGVAFIFNQKFFQDLREATGVDLENIVYYKDDTHYFVMTAKKQSLLEKGVILHDYADTEMLLSRANVDQAALLSYACEAADFSTNRQLPALDFAINHYGLPDVAMFDFTCMYASENAALVRQRHGHKLLVALVGDSLLEPFWPMGTGIARGFLAGIDSAWMVRSWAQGNSPLEVLAERESIYRLLPQTTPENVSKNFSHYSVDPTTRYPNVSLNFLRPNQVRHLIDNGESREMRIEIENVINSASSKLTRNESIARSSKLLNWCQRQTEGYKNVNVTDLTTSWKSGLALCALIHRYRPDLMEYDSLDERNQERNNQLAFDVAEREFGISPCMTGKEMTSVAEPDKLSMVMYISQFYEMFKDTVPPGDNPNLSPEDKTALIASTKSPISFLSKLGQSIAISRKRNPKDKKEKETDGLGKRRKTIQAGNSEDEDQVRTGPDDRPSPSTTLTDRRVDPSATAGGRDNKVKVMANQLLAKFEENAPEKSTGLKRQGSLRKEFPVNIGGSDVCFFCSKRVYVMERLSAEGRFFHRSCFKCDYCGTTLRLSSYAFDVEDGKFYCKPHYCYRSSGQGQRKRPAPSPALPRPKTEIVAASRPDPAMVDAPQGAGLVTPTGPSAERRSSVPEANGLPEPVLPKRLRGTPERIELENYQLSLQREEVLEEVPEETLAEHNLSSVLDKTLHADPGSSSSESDMDDEDEEEEEEEPEEVEQQQLQEEVQQQQQEEEEEQSLPKSPSDLGGVPWREAVELHAKLKGDSEEGGEGGEGGEEGAIRREEEEEGADAEDEYEEDEEEEEDDEEESSDEGEYFPWERELQSGLWLEKYLTDEEDVGTFKARNLLIQQVLQPVDPRAPASLGGRAPGVDSEGNRPLSNTSQLSQPSEQTQLSSTAVAAASTHASPRQDAVRVWLDSISGEPCEDLEPEQEAYAPDLEPGTQMDQDDIPSDAEAEARLHPSEHVQSLPAEDRKSRFLGNVSSVEVSSISPFQKEDIIVSPSKPSAELEIQIKPPSPRSSVESPSSPFSPAPFVPETALPESAPPSPLPGSPRGCSPSPAVSPGPTPGPTPALSPALTPALTPAPSPGLPASPAVSPAPSPTTFAFTPPIRSQPVPLPASSGASVSPVYPDRSICPLTGNPLSPICAPSLPCREAASPKASRSPVRTQPVPALSSTPRPDAADAEQPPDAPSEDTPSKKADIIEEFWLKSAEIRKSLGLTPLDRSSRILEKSPDTSSSSSSPAPSPPAPSASSTTTPKPLRPPSLSAEPKRPVIRRLNITLEGQVITPIAAPPSSAGALQGNGSDKKALSSSGGSGPGLQRSAAPRSRAAHSESSNASDSTMMTPPSSPPPPVPANQSPAVLRPQRHQVAWTNGKEKPGVTLANGPSAAKPKTPVSPPRVKSPVSPPRAKTPVSPQRAKTPVPTPRTQLSPVVTGPKPALRTPTSPIKAPKGEEEKEEKEEEVVVVVMREKKRPRREEARKSFVETVAEIPFADDVDENFDERTPETSLNKYYTPPTSLRPPLHLALAMENGKPNIPGHPRATQFSPEAKEIAEERMRAREKSIKSQALKDAMSKQLTKMKESDAVKSAASKVAWTVAAADNGGKGRKPAISPNTSAVKALESKKAETLPERFFGGNKSLDGSVASSEGSSGGKSKKRSSLFSPRKSKKEKKAKNEGGRPSGEGETPPKHKSLWKAVFSGYKKDKKKRQQSEEKSCPSTPSSSSTTQDSGKKGRSSPDGKSSELKSRRNLSFSEESDLSCDDVLERSSQKSKADKTYTEEELNAKLTRRVQKAARRQAKQEELKRLHRAQIIQRQLEQVEEKQRQLEERGVAVEKALRGEAGMGKKDDPKLMQEWFKLVQEKNALVRYESELMIFARELELEDRQSRLQQDLRERMAVEDHLKTEQELSREKQILNEMLEVVEQRDSLVALLEEQRLREKEEDKDLESVMLSKGFNLNWV